jgi:excisionase family DNA binding protein
MGRSDSPMAGRLFSCREAAKHLDVSDDTIRRMIHCGELQAVRIGKRILRVLGHSLEECSTPHRLVISGQATCTVTPAPATDSREGGVA